MASLYKRGSVYWVKYYRPGSRKPIRVSLDTTEEARAKKKLKILEGELAKGNDVDMRADRIRFGHLLDLVIADYKANGRRSLANLKSRTEGMKGDGGHVRPAFGDRRASTINAADIAFYVAKRQEAGARNSTINRELTVIKKAFTLAWRAYRLPGPHIEMLEENNIRTGFLEREQLESICRHLPPYLQPFARFALMTGWRVSEIRQLQWRHVDFTAGEIRLDPGTTKNKDGRVIIMFPELRSLLESVAADSKKSIVASKRPTKAKTLTAVLLPYVFTRRLKNGRVLKVGDFGRAWDRACREAGLPGRIFHDLRRSAVRLFVRNGIPERVAMQMTGHRTREVFERYNIVSNGDLEEAARKLGRGTFAGTARDRDLQNRKAMKGNN